MFERESSRETYNKSDRSCATCHYPQDLYNLTEFTYLLPVAGLNFAQTSKASNLIAMASNPRVTEHNLFPLDLETFLLCSLLFFVFKSGKRVAMSLKQSPASGPSRGRKAIRIVISSFLFLVVRPLLLLAMPFLLIASCYY